MRALLPFVLAAVVTVGCGSEQVAPPEGEPRAPARGNFTLYVSNQSFDRPEVDIRVEIDGQVVASDEFPVETQHTWVEFRLPLRPGTHVIRAITTRGDAVLERTFRMGAKRWAVLEYWCCGEPQDPRFTYDVSKRRIAFA